MKTKAIAYKPVTAYYCILIKDIYAGIEDYVSVCTLFSGIEDKVRKYKLYYTRKGAYFNFEGHRQYLSDFTKL